MRTQKTFNGTTTNYYYNGSVLIGMQKGSVVQRFSYDAQGKVVAVDYSTNGGSSYTTYYYLRNAQGDIVKLIDNNKNTVVEYTYDSWGKLISTAGSLATSLGANQPFRYRGYVYDNETGWYYLQSRYYDPNTCRFISSDVLLSTGQGVIGHNSYAYCLNTPVNGHDSDGEKFRPNDYSQECTDSGRGNRYKQWCFKPWIFDRYTREAGYFVTGEEELAIEAFKKGRIVHYNGAPVVRSKYESSYALFGTIHIHDRHRDVQTLRHEYGHIVHERELGRIRYFLFIGIPSYIACNTKEMKNPEYYSQPWEMPAEILGGNYDNPNRGYSYLDGAYENSLIYHWWIQHIILP